MINHISLKVSDLEESKQFYASVLGVLGYKVLAEDSKCVGLGTQDIEGMRDVWIRATDSLWLHDDQNKKVKSFSCLAFTASCKEEVDQFYAKALGAGGKDNGKPGYRKEYHPGYYAAFILDPDGNNIEAVFDNMEKV